MGTIRDLFKDKMIVPAGLLALLVFFMPLVPDVRLWRPKLLLIEVVVYSVFFMYLLISFLSARLELKKSPSSLPLALYISFSTLFYYFSPDKHIALNELKRTLLSAAGFLIFANITAADTKRKTIVLTMIFGGLLAILYGLLQHSGGIWMLAVPKMDRVMSTFGNPIFFGSFIAAMLPLSLGVFVQADKGKGFYALFMLCGIFALYYTRTRASFIALAVSFIVFILLNTHSAKKRFVLITVLAAGFAAFAFYTQDIWLRQQAHLLIWRDALAMWSSYPVFGTGPGTFHIYFPQFASPELRSIWPQTQFIVNDAHNEYVQLLAETGIAGFGAFVFLIFALFKNSLRIFKAVDKKDKALVSGLIASACAILAQNFFSVDMRFIISAVYLFMLFGLIESFNPETFSLRINSKPVRVFGALIALLLGIAAINQVLIPYRAQNKVAQTADFFDEKLLEPAKTAQDLQALALQYPDRSSIYEKLGWVYSKEKNFNAAIKSFEKAIQLAPATAGPYNNLGNIYFLQGDRNKAIELWENSLAINPAQTDSRLNLAVAYYYNGQLKQSSDHLRKVLELDPKNSKALVLLKQMTE